MGDVVGFVACTGAEEIRSNWVQVLDESNCILFTVFTVADTGGVAATCPSFP